jgi:hypothetical protein
MLYPYVVRTPGLIIINHGAMQRATDALQFDTTNVDETRRYFLLYIQCHAMLLGGNGPTFEVKRLMDIYEEVGWKPSDTTAHCRNIIHLWHARKRKLPMSS